MRHLGAAIAATFVFASFAVAQAVPAAATFQNPVIRGFAPDPSVCRAGDAFYLANSSFTMRPGLPIYRSRDLVSWTLVGHVVGPESGATFLGSTTNGGLYAPTIRYHDGTFYVIVKNTTSGHNELYATRDPAGRWDGPTRIGPDWDGDIDPDLFFDADGTAYVCRRVETGDGGARADQFAWRFDPRSARILSDRIPLWPGTRQHVWPEGGHLYRVGEYYYYQLAEGGTDLQHRVTIARRRVGRGLEADAALPWEPCPHNPLLFNDPATDPAVTTTGHADLVEDARGNWWAVFLAERRAPRPLLGRETFLTSVAWRDGWPVYNGGRPITRETTAPAPLPGDEPSTRPAAASRDDFDGGALSPEWNWLRAIDPATFSLVERPGSLTLHGTANGVTSKQGVAWLGRRLRDKAARITATMTFVPSADDQVAGINLFSTDASSTELIVRRAPGGGREAVVRVNAERREPTTRETTVSDAVPLAGAGAVRLRFELRDDRVTCRVASDGDAWRTVREVPVQEAIASPGFAGVYAAVHAVGIGATASFDSFAIEPIE